MKLYIHYEGSNKDSSFTTAISSTNHSDLLEDIIFDFCLQYEAATKVPLDPAEVEFVTSRGEKLLRYGNSLMKCNEIVDLNETDDLFLVDCKKRLVSMKENPATVSTQQPASQKSIDKSGESVMPEELQKSIAAAQNAMGKLYYKKSRDVISKCIKLAKKDCSLYELMCELLLLSKKDEEAVDFGEQAVEIATSLSTPTSRTGSSKRYLYFLLARAHFGAGNFEDCFAILKKCTNELGGPEKTGSATATMLPLECAKPSQRAHEKNGKVYYPWFHLDIAALRAECLFALGRHIEAADVVNSCMSDPNCESHMGILMAYSSFAAQYGKVQEAMRSLLKIVVVDQTEKKSRRLLASLLSTQEGIQEIQRQLPVGEKSSSAYGFLAMVAKDHSAIPASIKLLEFSLGGKPHNVGYLLNLMHVIELQGKYQDALDCCKSFLKIHGELVRVKGSKGFSSAELLAAMTAGAEGSPASAGAVTNADQVGMVVEWVPGSGEYERRLSKEKDGDPDEPCPEFGYVRALPLLQDPSSEVYSLGDFDEKEEDGVFIADNLKTLYDNESLDLLAVGFTVIKLLYLQGKFHLLPGLYQCIEPCRRRSREPIHETAIRNEHAYYQCIAQVLSYRLSCSSLCSKDAGTGTLYAANRILHTFPKPDYLSDPALICPDFTQLSPKDLKGLDKPIYVVGDSHVVPLAWNILSVGGQPRILRPLLATGIKHYHLRSEGDFYPKAQFVNNLKSIPNGSDILFVCGEIDCREGLLVAVEKDIYPNIQAGMRSTLKHFSAALPPLLKQRKMKNLFVHPVLPMLDETRPIVIEYNKFFKDIIDDLESKSKREKWGPGSLRWLNFFESLFVPGSGSESQQPQLLKGLRMDGTHISPAYLKLLEESLL